MDKGAKVLKELICHGKYKISLFSDGILEIDWDSAVDEVKVSHLEELKLIIKDLGKGKKMPIFISTFPFMDVSSDAKKYAASDEGQEFTLANAVLIDNLGKKLMFNFFININKPKTPTKAFQTKSEAIKWLRKLNNQHNRLNSL
jgi:hypothetical protein